MANPLRDHFGEVLLEQISNDKYPSGTHMDILEAVASPEIRVALILQLIEKIEADTHPSIPMMHRTVRLINDFGG
jgi:hypothetical protein